MGTGKSLYHIVNDPGLEKKLNGSGVAGYN